MPLLRSHRRLRIRFDGGLFELIFLLLELGWLLVPALWLAREENAAKRAVPGGAGT
jgi:hypothetical protein